MLQAFEEVRVEDAHPKIIDEEIFNDVQKILDSRKSLITYDSKHIYLLSGLVCCSSCGKTMVGSSQIGGRTKTKRYIYCCETHKAGACITKAINADYLESVVLDYVSPLANKFLNKDNFMKVLRKEIQRFTILVQKLEKDKKIITREIESYCSALSTCGDNKNIVRNLVKKLDEATKTEEELDEKLTDYKEKVASLSNLALDDVKFSKEKLLQNRVLARNVCNLLVKKVIVNENEDLIDIIIK